MANGRIPAHYFKNKRESKYKNEPIVIDGHKFPSKKEARRYNQLKIMEKAGEIHSLQLQVAFELQPKFTDIYSGKTIRAVKYVADFVYKDKEGNIHIEDAKGFKTDVYELKKKMMLYHGYNIEEV